MVRIRSRGNEENGREYIGGREERKRRMVKSRSRRKKVGEW